MLRQWAGPLAQSSGCNRALLPYCLTRNPKPRNFQGTLLLCWGVGAFFLEFMRICKGGFSQVAHLPGPGPLCAQAGRVVTFRAPCEEIHANGGRSWGNSLCNQRLGIAWVPIPRHGHDESLVCRNVLGVIDWDDCRDQGVRWIGLQLRDPAMQAQDEEEAGGWWWVGGGGCFWGGDGWRF